MIPMPILALSLALSIGFSTSQETANHRLETSLDALERAFAAQPQPEILLSMAAIHDGERSHCAQSIDTYKRFFAVCKECEALAYGTDRFERMVQRCVEKADDELALREEVGVARTHTVNAPPVYDVGESVEAPPSNEWVGCNSEPIKEVGYLTIDTDPWSEIYVNGKSFGETPVARIPVTTGCASIKAVAKDGQTVIRSVTVRPNKITIVKFNVGPQTPGSPHHRTPIVPSND